MAPVLAVGMPERLAGQTLTRRRRRKEILAVRVCFAGVVLGLAAGLRSVSRGAGNHASSSLAVEESQWESRHLLQDDVKSELFSEPEKNCTEPAIHEFPRDVFTNQERAEGAVGLHVLCTVYMFYALALVCDDYFVPSLEKICEHLHLSEDVAGATFMAAGSSAPELFTSIIGVFITKGDVGVGTIVGSAVFNILCIIGVCGLFTLQTIRLSCWPLLRDSIYYTLSISALIVFIYDEKVVWWEALILILMYFVYILIMKMNSRIVRFLESQKKSPSGLKNGAAGNADLDDGCDATAVLLKKPNHQRKASVLMVDELLSVFPHQLSFSEAGMRIMITSHFSPRTRLTMASRMIITERQRLINTQTLTNGDSDVPPKGRRGTKTGRSAAERRLSIRHSDQEAGVQMEDEKNGNDEEEEEDGEGPFVPFHCPGGLLNKLKWLMAWPLSLLFYLTIPNCSSPRWEKCFMLSFVSSTLWIAGLSYIMVWMVTVIGFTLGIPDVIMGITFLAAGTSVPDCMASLIVARQGMGDMAVSNSIGSNVFDILVGLGLPWALKTLAINYGSDIKLNSKGLIFSVGLLLGSVFLTVLGVHLNKWTLDKRLGISCLLLYLVFLCFSCLIEYNIFTFVNLPTCQDN
ncbi:sodium/potassium/calcium exchanger 3 isoform X2 [Oryzias melastigma]|uniref:sodium/potassium/calcium exchanger 3 isoform X2 n=1 Tax=Oryzias melastigma TaxID=30732 RepID=UPI000CF80A84|nr:sodium/potassium/calcium exchanger 3 isoform X2 [Oryzias melastigma]